MAVNDFTGSIAQTQLSFTTTSQITTVVGQNFQTPAIFMLDSDRAANLLGTYATTAVGSYVYLDSTNYVSASTGVLLTWLANFFAVNTTTQVVIAIYSTGTIATTYANVNNLAYFKMVFRAATETVGYKADVSALAVLCYGDKKMSLCVVGTDDAQTIVNGSTTSLAYQITNTNNADAWMAYKADQTYNSALTAVGITLATINVTGTPVGNPTDYVANLSVTPSGAAGASLDSTVRGILAGINVGHWMFVGDGTGQTVLNGFKTLRGYSTGADWMVAYINYISSTQTAAMLTAPGAPTFKNPSTYNLILNIISGVVTPFVGLGRLSGFKLTTTAFNKLPPAAGDTITIPNAWSAYYAERVGKVNVNGTLYIAS
jgi:hypothetical protein